MTTSDGPRWLHLSDIHVGMEAEQELWPRFGTQLRDDLARAVGRVCGIDLVVFSGDFAQRGAEEEFVRFERIVEDILDAATFEGARPKFVSVPGNHDLERPARLKPEAGALKAFWSERELRRGFWTSEGEVYRSFVGETLANYSASRRRMIERGLHLEATREGLLPGDATYVIDTPRGRMGVAALNSTWLQLGGGDYQGHLHVDVRQLLAVTDDEPDAWLRANAANLLVTHHPPDWFHKGDETSWDHDVSPPGRFDAHLYGHMHEPVTRSISYGGGLPNRTMQAPSLLGLEFLGDATTRRIQGYSLSSIAFDGGRRTLTSWPRRLERMTNGTFKMVRDEQQDLDDATGSFAIEYAVERAGVTSPRGAPPLSRATPGVASTIQAFDLEEVRLRLPDVRPHRNVRRIEQSLCVDALRRERIVWLSADWGMGQDGFVASIRDALGVEEANVFRLDTGAYRRREDFLDSFRIRYRSSFQLFCETVSEQGVALIVLDDAGTDGDADMAGMRDLELLAEVVSEFAERTFTIVRSRRRPDDARFSLVELGPLDEADVAVYARDGRNGTAGLGRPDTASILLRHTDGIPSRIDAALQDLEVMSLSDLLAGNADYTDGGAQSHASAPTLDLAIERLRASDDRVDGRAYELLIALSAFPQGEQLGRMRRFLGVHPFHPQHARILMEKFLVSTVGVTSMDRASDGETGRLLVVPRPVREHVRNSIDESVARETDRKALDLYFGDKWNVGNIRNSPTGKRLRSALCDGYEIQNAATLMFRAFRRASDARDEIEIERALKLASAFVDGLGEGQHYRSIASFCEDMLRQLEDVTGHGDAVASLQCDLAKSYRMLGRRDEAKRLFETLDKSRLRRSEVQGAELGLALLLEKEGGDEVEVVAQRVIELDRHSGAALQARTILAERLVDPTKRRAELRRHLATAERKGWTVLANNIMLTLASGPGAGDQAVELLRKVQKVGREKGDHYGSARAIIELARRVGAERPLTSDERARLIEAYQFLYNERIKGLFDSCHGQLWRQFEIAGDERNLLSLFRHSSFLWRLNGEHAQEARFVGMLAKRITHLLGREQRPSDRDATYFMVRVAAQLPDRERLSVELLPDEV